MRSKLFVPCTRPALFAKALASAADAVSFDLEDAVPDTGKDAARAALVEALQADVVRATAKTLIVRVNALGTAQFDADLAALAGARVDLVNLPKADDPLTVRAAAEAMDRAGVAAPLLVTIESARGLAEAAAIAGAHPRVAGVQAGLNDLFAALRIDRRDQRHVHAALWSLRLASGAAERFAYDGAWPDLDDEDGFRREAELARSLGYRGKSCVHPRQVAIANAVFDRGEELDAARRLLVAADAAAAAGRGAFTLDGRMIDRPAIEAARALVAEAARALVAEAAC